MAAYREHVTVSGLLGIGYGAMATLSMGFTPIQGCLAAALTWFAGMLPDLDSKNGRPLREVFSLLAAIVPFTMEHRLVMWGGSFEGAMFLAIVIYCTIRYGGAAILSRLTVHRGMFHSIPAAIVFAQLAFLGYESDSFEVRLLMAGGVLVGVLSHLILDEMYSVGWSGVRLKLNKAAGSAFKLIGPNALSNVVTYAILGVLTWTILQETGWVERPDLREGPFRQAAEPVPGRG